MKTRAWAGLALFGILTSGAGAAILNAPREYPTIQAGIDAGVDRDMVVVDEGTYYERIHFRGKNITIASLDPNDRGVVGYTTINATPTLQNCLIVGNRTYGVYGGTAEATLAPKPANQWHHCSQSDKSCVPCVCGAGFTVTAAASRQVWPGKRDIRIDFPAPRGYNNGIG